MFVDRDEAGTITGLFGLRQYEGQEELADDDPEVIARLELPRKTQEARESARALLTRRATELAASDDINDKLEAMNLRLQLLGG